MKSILEKIGVPQRPTKTEDRMQEYYLPEECVAEDFEVGEIVWSANHHAPAVIENKLSKEYQDSKPGIHTVDYVGKYGCNCYSILVRQKSSGNSDYYYDIPDIGGFFSFALAYDLGKLTHLEQYGINLENL